MTFKMEFHCTKAKKIKIRIRLSGIFSEKSFWNAGAYSSYFIINEDNRHKFFLK